MHILLLPSPSVVFWTSLWFSWGLLFFFFFPFPQNHVVICSWHLNLLWLQVAEKTALLRPIELKLVPVALEGSAFRSKFLDMDELMSYCGWFAVRTHESALSLSPEIGNYLMDWFTCFLLDSHAFCRVLFIHLFLLTRCWRINQFNVILTFADFQWFHPRMGAENQNCEEAKQNAGESSWVNID